MSAVASSGASSVSASGSAFSVACESGNSDSAFSNAPSSISNSSAGSDSNFSNSTIRTTRNKKVIKDIRIKKAVQFETGKDTVNAKGKAVVKAVALALKKRPKTKVTVEGHTFATELHKGARPPQFTPGTKKFNELAKRMQQLSLQRAKNVKTELVKNGVPAENIRAVGMGDRRPLKKGAGLDEELSKRVVFRTNVRKSVGRYGGAKGKKGTKKGGKKGSKKGGKKGSVGSKKGGAVVTAKKRSKGSKASKLGKGGKPTVAALAGLKKKSKVGGSSASSASSADGKKTKVVRKKKKAVSASSSSAGSDSSASSASSN